MTKRDKKTSTFRQQSYHLSESDPEFIIEEITQAWKAYEEVAVDQQRKSNDKIKKIRKKKEDK